MSKKERIIVPVLGDKGGSGKSHLSKALFERIRTLPGVRAFDADGTTGSFAQIYGVYDAEGNIISPQPADGVTPLMLHAEDRSGRDAALQQIIDSEADLILVDMPATSLTVLERVEKEWSFFNVLEQSGFSVVTINVVTPFKASLSNVSRTLALAPNAKPIVVFNELFGKRDKFVLWDYARGRKENGPSPSKQAFDGRGGIEIVLPALPIEEYALLDQDDLSFSAGIAGGHRDNPIPLRTRNYVNNWMKQVDANLAPLCKLLGLADTEAA